MVGESELERVAAVRRLEIIGSPPEERFDRITRLAREIFDMPVAEINFLDEDTQFTKSPYYPDATQYTPRPESFCDVTVQQPDLIVVPDATKDDRFSSRTTVTGPRHIRFYAGRPISVDSSARVGTLCLVDTRPREFTAEQQRVLDEMGSWVERELRATAELDRAVLVQRALLPGEEREWPGYDLAAVNLPSLGVGGDFYTWRSDDHRFDFLIADVMGKGAAGAIMAATVRATAIAVGDAPPAELLAAVDSQLAGDFDRTGTFATAVAGRLDLSSGVLTYADAGHGLSAIVRAGGTERLAATGLPLGISIGGGWRTESVELAPGDTLVSVTDGALEIGDGTLGALDDVLALVSSAPGASDAAGQLVARVQEARSVDDDVTALVLRRRVV